MQIDTEVEPLVRSTLDAAVHRDAERFGRALTAFPSDESLRTGLGIVAAVGAVALREMYDGNPTDEDLGKVAADVADMESWAGFSVADVYAHLNGLLEGRPWTTADEGPSLAFVVTGSLLASSPKVSAGEHWFTYLDRVEAAIEQNAR